MRTFFSSLNRIPNFSQVSPYSTFIMANSTSGDAAKKDRIMQHLNDGHKPELSRFLQHFCSIPFSEAAAPVLIDISFTSMAIATGPGNVHDCPINPPMATWADARTRCVEMDAEARKGLGLSDIFVNEYVPPSIGDVAVLEAILLLYASCILQGYVTEGNWVGELIMKWFPGGLSAWKLSVNIFAIPIFLVHILEAYMMAKKVERHGVLRYTDVWSKWVWGTFAEGFRSNMRLNALIAHKAKALKKDH